MSTNGSSKRAPMTLEGKVSIITGAASGIGEEVARVYADAGCKVAMIDFDKERLERIAKEIEADGGEVLPIYADVTPCALFSSRFMMRGARSTWWSTRLAEIVLRHP